MEILNGNFLNNDIVIYNQKVINSMVCCMFVYHEIISCKNKVINVVDSICF